MLWVFLKKYIINTLRLFYAGRYVFFTHTILYMLFFYNIGFCECSINIILLLLVFIKYYIHVWFLYQSWRLFSAKNYLFCSSLKKIYNTHRLLYSLIFFLCYFNILTVFIFIITGLTLYKLQLLFFYSHYLYILIILMVFLFLK